MITREWTRFGVIHCSATPPDMDVDIDQIDRWHRDRGIYQKNAPSGYHNVIKRDGSLQFGRHLRQAGAHARGFNFDSLSVCLVGGVDEDLQAEDNFRARQWDTLERVVQHWVAIWPDIQILGHRDVNPGKECPSFNVAEWLKIVGMEAHAWRGTR